MSKTNIDYAFYKNHPLFASLKLTNGEIDRFFNVIQLIINEQNTCDKHNDTECINSNRFHTRLVRHYHGRLEPVFVPCKKCETAIKIQSMYLMRSFADKDLNTLLDTKSIGKLADPTKAKLLKTFKSYLSSNASPKRGLYVYGKMGVGKTFTMIALANEFALKNKTVAFVVLSDLVQQIKEGFSENSINDALINKLKRVDVLFFDDVGVENAKEWFYDNYFFIILNHRMTHEKLTFFNSNVSVDAYSKKIKSLVRNPLDADRVIERIRALTNNVQFELHGSNRRY